MKFRLLLILVLLFVVAYNAAAQSVTQADNAKIGAFSQQEEKAVCVNLIAYNGVLTIKAEENITKIEIYSAIGGLLYQSAVNNTEFRIDNLPKTILVVRIKTGENKPVVQKIRMQ
ncbi:MAG: T9SS type A sorting domain-containing protein [Prevotellaceae bacterium]|jgi:hypothetical protein|nr:T9SS type A sorting domain-containing protein [Prevotellaceae bacterium]